MVKSSGESETHGELIGVKKDSFELSEERTILQLKTIVFGLYLKRIGTRNFRLILLQKKKRKKTITNQMKQLKTLRIE